MTPTHEIPASVSAYDRPPSVARGAWQLSLVLLTGAYVYLAAMYQGGLRQFALVDGDTYMHVAIGQWIIKNRVIPQTDPFSHTVPGIQWTAHEWLSEVLMAWAHALGDWTGLMALTSIAFALAISMLVRALLPLLSPTRTLLLAVLAVLMTMPHLLARPHMLALPLLVAWTIGLVRAADSRTGPPLWLLPVMVLWANLHGGFTLGLALAFGFAVEALLDGWRRGELTRVALRWSRFLALALLASLLTPHGLDGILFTWQLLIEEQYAISRVGEWASPNFHYFQPLMLWLLLGLAVVLYQGLRLPPVRLAMLLGLIYLSLKHARNVELLGLLGPLLIASSFGAQWRQRAASAAPDPIARGLARLTAPAGIFGTAGCIALLTVLTAAVAQWRPITPPEHMFPEKPLAAAMEAGVAGPVLNDYGWGGFLMLAGVPVYIDGRADMYREPVMRPYLEALEQRPPGGLESLLDKYGITWTMLSPKTPAVGVLDQLPGWRRIYLDDVAVVHKRIDLHPKQASAKDAESTGRP